MLDAKESFIGITCQYFVQLSAQCRIASTADLFGEDHRLTAECPESLRNDVFATEWSYIFFAVDALTNYFNRHLEMERRD